MHLGPKVKESFLNIYFALKMKRSRLKIFFDTSEINHEKMSLTDKKVLEEERVFDYGFIVAIRTLMWLI